MGVIALVRLPAGAGAGAAEPQRYLDPVFASVQVTTGLVYRTATDCEGATVPLALDLYEPEGDTAAPRPLLVWIHGGSFAIGARDGALEVAVAEAWARRGYVVASISYRLCDTLSPQVLEDAYQDAAAAVAWLRAGAATHRIDVDRVVVGGASAGAITALQVGFTPDIEAGGGGPDDPSRADAVLSMAGMWLPGVVQPGEPPVLMAHGTSDPIIPFSAAEDFCTGAVAVGVDCRLHAYDAEHETLVAHVEDIQARSFAFLYEVLDLAGAEPAPAPTTIATSTTARAAATSAPPSPTSTAPAPPAVPAVVAPTFTG